MIASAHDLAATARPLHLQRRTDVDVESLVVRGKRWWRLRDPIRLRFWQLGDEEHFLWSHLDQECSLRSLQQQFLRQFTPRRIELAHLHQFLGTLHREGLVYSSASGQGDILLERQSQQRARRRFQWLTNLLAIRFRGIDPTGLLQWLGPRLAWAFKPLSLAVSLMLILSAVLLAMTSASEIVARLPQVTDYLTPTNVLWLAATIAAVKICHEFAHALTCTNLGGRCHELGVMLLIFTPCLYCNVTDAWLFPSRWRRMAVSAAGMWIELVLAALATWLWWFAEPGWISTLCLNVMMVCSVNTLLFNGNPLLRFDGYFLLSDFLDVPNLRQASDEWLRRTFGRVVLGIRTSQGDSMPHDRPIVVGFYAILSLAYRLVLTVLVWWFLYHWLAQLQLAILGAGIVFLSASAMVGQTIWSGYQVWRSAWRGGQVRKGRASVSLLVFAAIVGLLVFVRFPRAVKAPAAVRPANAATIYVPVAGTLVTAVRPGVQVEPGHVLAQLRNPNLELEILQVTGERDVLQQQVASLKRQQVQESSTGATSPAGQLRTVERQLADVTARLEQKQLDLDQLTIRAPRGGIVIADRDIRGTGDSKELRRWEGSALDLRNAGCSLEPGEILCHIAEPTQREALVVVDQAEIDAIHEGQSARLQLDELPRAYLTGRVRAINELSAEGMPEEIAAKRLLPVREQNTEARLLGRHYQVIVALDPGPRVPWGASGHAKISVQPQTFAARAYELVCRTFRW